MLKPASLEEFSQKGNNTPQHLDQVIADIEPGSNVLVDRGEELTLLKYEDAGLRPHDPLIQRQNRLVSFCCMGNVVPPYWAHEDEEAMRQWKERKAQHPFTHRNPDQRIERQLHADFLGYHAIEFTWDDALGIHKPSSEASDVFLRIADRYATGRIEYAHQEVAFITGDTIIEERLREVCRPRYFEKNIVPFLEEQSSGLSLPSWRNRWNLPGKMLGTRDSRQPNYARFNMRRGLEWLDNVTGDLQPGDIIYVGSNEQAQLYQLAADAWGRPSIENAEGVCFINDYVATKPCEELEQGNTGVLDHLVVSQIRRPGKALPLMFRGEPELITADMSEALEHFSTTDFAEFTDVAAQYAQNALKQSSRSYRLQ